MIELNEVWDRLKGVYDPEIGVNLVDLGLIYSITEAEEGVLHVEMTMTTPGCPAHDSMSGEVEWAAAQGFGVGTVYVDVVWDPPWSPELMSDEARKQLGF